MTNENEKLSVRLREWHAVEPTAGFESGVWRRIHSRDVSSRQPDDAGVGFFGWLARPAWGTALAASVGIALGVGLALSSLPGPPGQTGGEPVLHHGTLAGSYLAMVSGERP